MDLAVVSNVAHPFVTGGAQKRIHELGTRLVDEGHDVTVYTRHWWDGPSEYQHEGLTFRAIGPARELHAGDRRSIREAIDFALHVPGPIRRHADDHDVVDASVFPYFPVIATKLGTLFHPTPLATTWHEVWLDYWDRYLGRLAPFGKLTERVTANLPQVPIAVSELTADRLARIGPSREAIEVVPNGVDVAEIRAIDPATDGFDVLFAGRLIADKNVDVLLRAFDGAADSFPDATLGVIGDGPERDRIDRQARSLANADRVSVLGFLDEYDDVLAHMHAATAFVSPSIREGFGITYLEAMAANCTVVAVDHPTSTAREVIDDAGFVTDVDEEAIAAAIERALAGGRPEADPVDRARQYDWDEIASCAERVYRSSLSSGPMP